MVSLALMQQLFDSYAKGGDLDVVIADTNNASYSGGFNYFVSLFGAFFGPFPSLFPKVTGNLSNLPPPGTGCVARHPVLLYN